MNRRFMAALLLAPALFASAAAENRGKTRVGYLVVSEGAVELKRTSWNRFHPVGAGAELLEKDLLRLGPDARGVILCADFKTVWRPPRGGRSDVSQRCKKVRGPLSKLSDGLAVDTRSGGDKSERIRSPRHAIRDPAPWIRWESFGAKEYEVRVLLGSRTIWGPVLAEGTEYRMPSGFLQEPERPYRVQVRALGTSDYVEPVIPFHLIGEDRRREIEHGEGMLLESFQDESVEKQLAQALYLTHQQLYDEALMILDGLGPELRSAVSELLGARLALGLGFRKNAEERFERARDLARGQLDLETEAAAFVGLGRTAIKREKSEELLQIAIALYEKIGAENRAEALRKELGSH